jgi:hypothetical protein
MSIQLPSFFQVSIQAYRANVQEPVAALFVYILCKNIEMEYSRFRNEGME